MGMIGTGEALTLEAATGAGIIYRGGGAQHCGR